MAQHHLFKARFGQHLHHHPSVALLSKLFSFEIQFPVMIPLMFSILMFRWVSQPHCIWGLASILACCRRTPCCLLLRLLHCSGPSYLLLQCAGCYRCCHGCSNGACRSSSYHWQLHLLRATHCSHLLGRTLYCRSHCCHCLNLKQLNC